MNPILEFHDVSKVFFKGSQQVHALSQVTAEVGDGELLAIVGPSGCGKSTLLNLAAGLMKPGTGRLLYRGNPLTGVNTEVAYITQKDNLLPWRTVEDNIALPSASVDEPASPSRSGRNASLARSSWSD